MVNDAFSPGQIIMAVYLPAYVLILFGKSYRVRQTTGRDPLRLRRGKTGLTLVVETGLTICLALLAFSTLLYIFRPGALEAAGSIGAPYRGGGTAAGAAVLAGAMWLAIRAVLDSGENWRVGIDVDMEEPPPPEGIYAAIRAPLALSIFLTGLGLCLLSGTVLALMLLGTTAACLHLETLAEERWRRERSPAAYLDYLRKTGRYLPRFIFRPRPGSTRR